MNQQINLYQPMFRREKKVFSAAAMVQLGLVALLGLMGIYGYSKWQTDNVDQVLIRLTAERDLRELSLAKLRGQYPERIKSKILENELAEKTKQVEARKQIAEVLAGGAFGNTKGYAAHFEALARRHVEGTWLRRIKISAGGKHLAIAGHTLFPELVPVYIQRLARETVFDEVKFNVLDLAVAEQSDDYFSFVFATAPAGGQP